MAKPLTPYELLGLGLLIGSLLAALSVAGALIVAKPAGLQPPEPVTCEIGYRA